MAKSLIALTFGLMLSVPVAQAGDASAGKAKSEGCAQCHGDTGKEDPAIAGMDETKFIQAMHAYQSGEHKSRKMRKAASLLSDADIANLAAYYATLK